MLAELGATLPDCQLVAIDSYPLLRPVKQVSAYRMEPNRTGAILTIDDIPEVMQLKAWDMVLDNRRLTMADVADVFHLESVDCVVHVGSLYDRSNPEQFVRDTENWVQACQLAGVRQLVYLSDIRVYGTKGENPIPLTERSNLNPAAEHRFILDAELQLQESFGSAGPPDSLKIAVLRSAMTAGPSGCSPATDELLWPAVASNRNRSIPIQLVHQHDLTRAVWLTLLHQLNGIYNVASRGVVRSKDVLDMFQNGTGSKANRSKSKRRAKSAAHGMGKHPLIVSDTKFRQAAKFEAAYSSEQTARAYCHSYLYGMSSGHDQ
ncbi:MAG: hypothetical protein F4X64_08240 [Chloroflexi bacterium]|nr:hypothetical protein [Chloroflexota bacterium]